MTTRGDDEEMEPLDEGFHLDMAEESDDKGVLEGIWQPLEDEWDKEEDIE
jgi:hypothetical protein